jgi:hypothetical protein
LKRNPPEEWLFRWKYQLLDADSGRQGKCFMCKKNPPIKINLLIYIWNFLSPEWNKKRHQNLKRLSLKK